MVAVFSLAANSAEYLHMSNARRASPEIDATYEYKQCHQLSILICICDLIKLWAKRTIDRGALLYS